MIHGVQSGRSLSVFAVLLAFGAGSACGPTKPRTQVMLVVDADDAVRGMTNTLKVDVEGRTASGAASGPSTPQQFGPMEPDGPTWPFEIALVPREGDRTRTYRVTATVFQGDNPIARLRAESGFVPGKTIELRLTFEQSCLRSASLSCTDTETCAAGSCVAALIDQTMLPMYAGGTTVTIPEIDGGLPTTGMKTGTIMGVSGTGAAGSGGRMSGGTSGSGGASGGAGAAGMAMSDPSMPGNCGDGKLTGDETCDTAIAADQPGACPTECRPSSACEPTQLEGTGCHTRCTPHTITALDSGDGCCPAGADANGDTDCRSQCGNGQIETGEACDPVEKCPTPATCTSANACLKAVIIGDATACTATCTMQAIIECKSDDGCCPSDCNSGNDNDCSASCGNGVVDRGESCEDASATPCQTLASCNDNNACTVELFTGSARNCNALCTEVPVIAPFDGDGCCPELFGANANNDNDCQPKCGNGIVERGERCDGKCPVAADCDDGNACTRDTLGGSNCTAMCAHTPITAPSRTSDGCCPAGANASNDTDCTPSCGNGVTEPGETCDGRDCPACADNDPCTREQVTANPDACHPKCGHIPLAPGEGTCPAPQPTCGDGIKNGDEACDPPQAACPACTDTDNCTREQVTNNPDACHPKCDHITLAPGEGTCPAPLPTCGDGIKNGDEACDPPQAACPACTDTDNCTREQVTNNPDACHPKCDHIALPPGEGTCPAAPACGDGIKNGDETCDPPQAACPACTAADNCMIGTVTNTPDACHPVCTQVARGSVADGFCCPPGSPMSVDPDCPPPAI